MHYEKALDLTLQLIDLILETYQKEDPNCDCGKCNKNPNRRLGSLVDRLIDILIHFHKFEGGGESERDPIASVFQYIKPKLSENDYFAVKKAYISRNLPPAARLIGILSGGGDDTDTLEDTVRENAELFGDAEPSQEKEPESEKAQESVETEKNDQQAEEQTKAD